MSDANEQAEPTEPTQAQNRPAEYWRLIGVADSGQSLWVNGEKPKRVRLSSFRQNDRPSPNHRIKLCRLMETDIPVIDRFYHTEGMSIRTIAGHFGVSKNTIQRVIERKTWKYVPNQFGSGVRSPKLIALRGLRNFCTKSTFSAGHVSLTRKLDEFDVACLRNLRARGKTISSLARSWKIAKQTCSLLLAKKTYQECSGTYVVLPPEELLADCGSE